MSKLIQRKVVEILLQSLPYRSDIHPEESLKALIRFRERMSNDIDDDALAMIDARIKDRQENNPK